MRRDGYFKVGLGLMLFALAVFGLNEALIIITCEVEPIEKITWPIFVASCMMAITSFLFAVFHD